MQGNAPLQMSAMRQDVLVRATQELWQVQEPLLEQAAKESERKRKMSEKLGVYYTPESAIRAIDPACGSGHFLTNQVRETEIKRRRVMLHIIRRTKPRCTFHPDAVGGWEPDESTGDGTWAVRPRYRHWLITAMLASIFAAAAIAAYMILRPIESIHEGGPVVTTQITPAGPHFSKPVKAKKAKRNNKG